MAAELLPHRRARARVGYTYVSVTFGCRHCRTVVDDHTVPGGKAGEAETTDEGKRSSDQPNSAIQDTTRVAGRPPAVGVSRGGAGAIR